MDPFSSAVLVRLASAVVLPKIKTTRAIDPLLCCVPIPTRWNLRAGSYVRCESFTSSFCPLVRAVSDTVWMADPLIYSRMTG